MYIISEESTKQENAYAVAAMAVGVSLMAIMIYLFYFISQTCVYPLVDGKCQNQVTEQPQEQEDINL